MVQVRRWEASPEPGPEEFDREPITKEREVRVERRDDRQPQLRTPPVPDISAVVEAAGARR